MDTIVQDVRYAVRQIARAPLFSAVAICLLGLGIGLVATLFTIIHSINGRPAPGIENADGLVRIVRMSQRPSRGALSAYTQNLSSRANHDYLIALREERSVFAEVIGWSARSEAVSIRLDEGPVSARAIFTSQGYFSTLRLPMTLGSGVFPPDDVADPAAVAVVSRRFWERVLDTSTTAVGRVVSINGTPFTIIGVAPASFNGVDYDPFEYSDVWVPITWYPRWSPQSHLSLEIAARLTPGVSESQAAAVASAVASRRVVRVPPDADGRRGVIRQWAEVRVLSALPASMDTQVPVIYVLHVAAAIILLLITCTNVSSMLLGKAIGRRHEIGVRLSLGAGRWRIVRQLLTESTVLAVLAGAAASLVLIWSLEALAALVVPISPDLSPQWQTFAALLGIALVTGVAFGLLPALHASRLEVAQTLKDAAPGHDRRRSRLQGAFVVSQLALTLPLLATAGAILGFIAVWLNRPAGYDTSSRVIAVEIDFGPRRTTAAELNALLTSARDRLAGVPGVVQASTTSALPPGERDGEWRCADENCQGRRRVGGFRRPDDEPGSAAGDHLLSYIAYVDPGYFDAIGIALRRGRDVQSADTEGAVPVAVVSEDFARRMWPESDPLGKTLIRRPPMTGRQSRADTAYTVVGVVSAVRSIDGEAPTVYVPRRQQPATYIDEWLEQGNRFTRTLVVRTSRSDATMIPFIRRELQSIDRDVVIARAETLAERQEAAAQPYRTMLWAALGVGLVMLVLSSIGTFTIIAFGVANRTREIGIRIALGARTGQVIAMFVRQGIQLTVIGLVLGIPIAIWAMKILGHELGVSSWRQVSIATISCVLIGVAALASWLPARRAARVNPVDALRAE